MDSCSNASCLASTPGEGIESASRCKDFYASLPERGAFFRRVLRPANVPEERFGRMLAKGGVHPRGVVLDSEFYELPLKLNQTLLEKEVASLLASDGFEPADKENVMQGVVSQHMRLTRSRGKDLEGPFEEVDGRMARSPYIRSVLGALGGVVGNVALMNLEPGGLVDTHFDTNEYWSVRVRIHIPIRSNRKVIFSCGQVDGMQKIRMKPGRAYLFDNHLGHRVKNGGKSSRLHMVVDMVGNRRFWALVAQARAIGSAPKQASGPAQSVSEVDDARVVIEAWRDAELQNGCSAVAKAVVVTARQLGLEAQGRQVAEAWCKGLQDRALSRKEEIRALQRLATMHTCDSGSGASFIGANSVGFVGLAEVADAVAEIHRIGEADAELRTLSGEVA